MLPPGIGVPYALISKLEEVQDILEKLSDVNKDLKKKLINSFNISYYIFNYNFKIFKNNR